MESSYVVVALIKNYSTSKPLNIPPEKLLILSCDTVVANERYHFFTPYYSNVYQSQLDSWWAVNPCCISWLSETASWYFVLRTATSHVMILRSGFFPLHFEGKLLPPQCFGDYLEDGNRTFLRNTETRTQNTKPRSPWNLLLKLISLLFTI